MDPAELASAWAHSRWYMGSVIIGANTVVQLEANWKAASIELGEEIPLKIDAIHMKARKPSCVD